MAERVVVGTDWGSWVQVLVLCPNALLCSQVAGVAAGLKDSPDAPKSFLRSYQVTSTKGLYKVTTDVLVATPAGLLNELLQVRVCGCPRCLYRFARNPGR